MSMVMNYLQKIDLFLNSYLNVNNTPDYSAAHNGVQLQNDGKVASVISAVDASEAVIQKAIEAGAELLIVHHGMFWHGVQMLTDAFYRKVKLAMDHNLAIYSSHLPLDVHPESGNNILLAQAIGLDATVPFGDYKGIPVGVRQESNRSFLEIVETCKCVLGGGVHYCAGGEVEAGMVGVVTGGAGSEVKAMAEAGIDTFITGEGPHWSFSLAEELGINVIYGGHYATEVFGVEYIAGVVSEKFGIQNFGFIDHPSGL